MKTAEEWTNLLGLKTQNVFTLDEIKQIQLDAWKQGMTDAAELFSIKMRNYYPVVVPDFELKITEAILHARDERKSL